MYTNNHLCQKKVYNHPQLLYKIAIIIIILQRWLFVVYIPNIMYNKLHGTFLTHVKTCLNNNNIK